MHIYCAGNSYSIAFSDRYRNSFQFDHLFGRKHDAYRFGSNNLYLEPRCFDRNFGYRFTGHDHDLYGHRIEWRMQQHRAGYGNG